MVFHQSKGNSGLCVSSFLVEGDMGWGGGGGDKSPREKWHKSGRREGRKRHSKGGRNCEKTSDILQHFIIHVPYFTIDMEQIGENGYEKVREVGVKGTGGSDPLSPSIISKHLKFCQKITLHCMPYYKFSSWCMLWNVVHTVSVTASHV